MKITTYKWVNGKHEPDKEVEVKDLLFTVDFGGDDEPEQRIWLIEQDGRLHVSSGDHRSEVALFPGDRAVAIECKMVLQTGAAAR